MNAERNMSADILKSIEPKLLQFLFDGIGRTKVQTAGFIGATWPFEYPCFC